MPEVQTGPILADYSRIDVRFTLPFPGDVIDGLPTRENFFTLREKDTMHAANAVEAGKAELAVVGRHRKGRVDTGEPAIKNLDFVQLATLRRAFTNNGWVFAETFSFPHSVSKKPVVVLRYRKMEEGATLLQPANSVTEAIRRLGNLTWGVVNVWANPDKSITINANAPKKDTLPKRALIVNDGYLGFKMVEVKVTEDEENQMR